MPQLFFRYDNRDMRDGGNRFDDNSGYSKPRQNSFEQQRSNSYNRRDDDNDQRSNGGMVFFKFIAESRVLIGPCKHMIQILNFIFTD